MNLEPKNFRWIAAEDVGVEQMYIAQTKRDALVYVWLDKYGIANVFDTLQDLFDYYGGNLNCNRTCFDPYETDIEGVDFIDLELDKYIDKKFGRYSNVDTADWNEARLDVIGQNGNEGLHYDQ